MAVQDTICELMDVLETASDGELISALAKLDQLRRLTAGADREMVISAVQECRELLTPAGQLRRALNLAVSQG